MNVPTLLLAPALLTAVTVTYVVAGPSRHAPGQASAELAASAESATPPSGEATAPALEPTSTATPDVPDTLPAGLSGKLTYRTGHELVTVHFPDATETDRTRSVASVSEAVSADGEWRARRECTSPESSATRTQHCHIDLIAVDGRNRALDVDIDLQWSRALQWSPAGHVLAMLVEQPDGHGNRLAILDEPASGDLRFLQGGPRIDAPLVSAFAWIADGRLLAARGDGTGFALFRVDAATGAEEVVAKLAEPPNFLYPSPDGARFAFAGSGVPGWHLYLFDPAHPFDIRDLGAMGSDGPGATPVVGAPDTKVPMYIAWSPDGSMLAFGGGFEPPYFMTIVDLVSGTVRRTAFSDGYPGEIKWSPDGAMLAVSSYNIPRTHHESYVVDPKTGIARDVLSGCVIIWSPDSRFLAIHGEQEPGVAIADVATLEHAQLSHGVGDTPLRWER